MAKKQKAVQEVKAQEEKEIRCGFFVAVYDDGSVEFTPVGKEPHLVTLQGLLKYAELNMEENWARLQKQGE